MTFELLFNYKSNNSSVEFFSTIEFIWINIGEAMKQKKLLLLVIIILLSSFALLANANVKIIPLTSSLYDDMDMLYQLSGISAPSGARPWSSREAELILSKVNKTTLPSNLIKLYERIEEVIHADLDIAYDSLSSGSFNLELALEGYYHTNTDSYTTEKDWIYSFEERKPLAKLEIEYALSDWMYMYADVEYGKGRTHSDDETKSLNDLFTNPSGLGTFIPPFDEEYTGKMNFASKHYMNSFNGNMNFKSHDFETDWPKRAFISFGGANWSATLGRDKIKWGNGKTGNFIVDSYSEYNEFLRLSTFTENYKFEWLALAFNTNTSTGGGSFDRDFKLLLAHRFEFRLWDKVTFAISENVAYQNDIFLFNYLNPSFIYHNNVARDMFNAIAHVELDVALPYGLKGYFQFVMDQAQAPNEDDSQKSAIGFLTGINYATIFDNSNQLSINAEFALTNPLLYRRDIVDFINLKKTHTFGTPYNGVVLIPEYIGYKYGGDAIVFQLDAEYKIPTFGSISAQFFFMKHGKMNFFLSHNEDGDNDGAANYQGGTPSGKPEEIETTFVYTLGFDFNVPVNLSFMDITIYSDLSYIATHNKLVYNPSGKNETVLINKLGWSNDLQITFGACIRL